ncbi:tetratricopeptide repeat protein [Methylocucumis oryzae]|uniref:tetratricopeptide repeat protein n=1 Tax=Methylocucumis oryzae TaxID=1632867 RepID=UPI000697EC72|nr:sel1 repeat family protein [Methylocucumis oryzae]
MKWLREAAIQYHEAANAWLENALLRLAFPHLVDKKNAEKDYQFAFDWCLKEAEQNSAEAYLCLGILYKFGKGVEQNDQRAFECFSEADQLGERYCELDFIISLNLGIFYAQGKGVKQDIDRAKTSL